MSAMNRSAPPTRDDRELEAVYREHFAFLVSIAVRKFGVPTSEAETLVQDVFLTLIKRSDEVHDIHSWLLGAICHASRYYWRQRGRGGETVEVDILFEHIDPSTHNVRETFPDVLTVRDVLESLPPRYRLILRMRYYDGCSIAEIAESLGVKPKYAQKLVTKCLRKAEQTYRSKGRKR